MRLDLTLSLPAPDAGPTARSVRGRAASVAARPRVKTAWPGSSSVREYADFGSQESENGSKEVLRDGSHPSSMCTDGLDSWTGQFWMKTF